MPRDTTTAVVSTVPPESDPPASPLAPPRKPLTLAELLADDDEGREVPAIGPLPSLSGHGVIPRSPRTLPVPDLTRSLKAWLLLGEGNVGKTLYARALLAKLLDLDAADGTILAAIAPGNRNLERFAEGVMQPPGLDSRETAAWLHKFLHAMARRRRHGILDSGGGDQATAEMIRAAPDLPERLEEGGLALVAAYFFGPRVDDLVYLADHEARGFRPRATALVLNLARAESPSAFDDIRRQPAYRAALDRGAVELWLPALAQDVALAIERKGLNFGQARDGVSPEGRDVAPLGMLQRTQLRNWLAAVDAELAPIGSWMPWDA